MHTLLFPQEVAPIIWKEHQDSNLRSWDQSPLPYRLAMLLQFGGGGWIRTTEAETPDLQSGPFDHSGTPPEFLPLVVIVISHILSAKQC